MARSFTRAVGLSLTVIFDDYFQQLQLFTKRLILEPITEHHARELCELFSDVELHKFVPFQPPTLEKQIERCKVWEQRRSPDGSELWLNWAAREKKLNCVLAHIQAGVKEDRVASIGYVVSRNFQRQGFAAECLEAVFKYLHEELKVREVSAWSDTRNEASHRLAKKLGMVQTKFIKDADFFKGEKSDEWVFTKVF